MLHSIFNPFSISRREVVYALQSIGDAATSILYATYTTCLSVLQIGSWGAPPLTRAIQRHTFQEARNGWLGLGFAKMYYLCEACGHKFHSSQLYPTASCWLEICPAKAAIPSLLDFVPPNNALVESTEFFQPEMDPSSQDGQLTPQDISFESFEPLSRFVGQIANQMSYRLRHFEIWKPIRPVILSCSQPDCRCKVLAFGFEHHRVVGALMDEQFNVLKLVSVTTQHSPSNLSGSAFPSFPEGEHFTALSHHVITIGLLHHELQPVVPPYWVGCGKIGRLNTYIYATPNLEDCELPQPLVELQAPAAPVSLQGVQSSIPLLSNKPGRHSLRRYNKLHKSAVRICNILIEGFEPYNQPLFVLNRDVEPAHELLAPTMVAYTILGEVGGFYVALEDYNHSATFGVMPKDNTKQVPLPRGVWHSQFGDLHCRKVANNLSIVPQAVATVPYRGGHALGVHPVLKGHSYWYYSEPYGQKILVGMPSHPLNETPSPSRKCLCEEFTDLINHNDLPWKSFKALKALIQDRAVLRHINRLGLSDNDVVFHYNKTLLQLIDRTGAIAEVRVFGTNFRLGQEPARRYMLMNGCFPFAVLNRGGSRTVEYLHMDVLQVHSDSFAFLLKQVPE